MRSLGLNSRSWRIGRAEYEAKVADNLLARELEELKDGDFLHDAELLDRGGGIPVLKLDVDEGGFLLVDLFEVLL